jgi:MbtH protein
LIRLDSAKEIQGFEFEFRCAGFGFCCARLGFPCGGFGNPSSRWRVGLPWGPAQPAEKAQFGAKVEHRRLRLAHEVLSSRPLTHRMQLETQINKSYVSPSVPLGSGNARKNCLRRVNGGGRVVMEDDEKDRRNYLVVRNSEEQYSIWPSHKPVPRGWQSLGKEARKAECLRIIEEMWVDMRPRSLRNSESGSRQAKSPNDPM